SSPRRASHFLVFDKKVTKEATPQRRWPAADPLRCAVEKAAAELVATLLKQSSPTATPRPSRPVLLGDAEWGAHITQHGCSDEQQKPLFLNACVSAGALANQTSLLIERRQSFRNGGCRFAFPAYALPATSETSLRVLHALCGTRTTRHAQCRGLCSTHIEVFAMAGPF
ncbi:hypothetical protein ACDA63_05085, partial [Uliginosibacterium sp. sgz301328]|uniref:hypothetical protein n=1 Tax=Uliginosibacterium sp. sgz301328 TaxID=3243764 RepID=UPI00359E0019